MTDAPRSPDALSPDRVTTAFDLPGHTTVRALGVAQGIVVRSRSIIGTFGASLQTLFGGNITLYTSLCEKARQHAFDKMLDDARRLGANAVVAMRYDSTEIGSGVTEVICYGTAVQVAPDAGR
ncbi:YbjQ family protein [Burkholderia multivorans]|uniref:YbjQ family protein n=1 Tax=Burkholderia multivorans TaxID=87883 RepID=UPI000CFF73C1|nr:YbjQ family protein [Burkholderia multivorans]MBU9143132.1 YbjQ family protein [Burkholderia multivorans]MCA8337964.1 YbjQ family protein [Burkholderia multivorans]MDN7477149.1 YbjQ family protein [Burkholderia multivorans]PRE06136.1 hypothetical protein C6P91_09480 [Burkholderia multivorans]UXZ64313.1 YbjQ family protein [Burkholderia multivorans]